MKQDKSQRNMGRITCPFCLSKSKVHRNKSGRLYIHCPSDGPINVHGDGYQDYVEDNMTPYDENTAPPTDNTPPPPAVPARVPDEVDEIIEAAAQDGGDDWGLVYG